MLTVAFIIDEDRMLLSKLLSVICNNYGISL